MSMQMIRPAPCINVDPFVSHHLTLNDVNRGFDLMERQDGIRRAIHSSSGPGLPPGIQQDDARPARQWRGRMLSGPHPRGPVPPGIHAGRAPAQPRAAPPPGPGGVVRAGAAAHMPGQLCEPLPVRPDGAAPCDGVVVVLVPLVVVCDEVAALAIAAPPPASAPVTTSAASSGLARNMWFTSFHCHTPSRRSVGAS
jgi:hypothetical protein